MSTRGVSTPGVSKAAGSPPPRLPGNEGDPASTADLDALQARMKADPSNPDGYLALAEAQLGAGKSERAYSTFRAVKSLAPRDPRVFRLGARILDLLGRRDESIALLERVLKLAPEDVGATLESARMLHELGRREQSLERLETLRAHAREHPGLLLQMAQVQLSLGDAAAAQQDLSQYRKIAGNTLDMFLLLGKAMMAQHFYDGAVRHYREALALFPEHPDLHFGLARAYLGTGERGQAQLELEQANQASPNRPEILLELGRLAYDMANEDRGEEMFDRVRSQNIRDGEIFLDLARFYQNRQKPARALEELERAQDCSPHHPEIVRMFCEVLEAEDATSRALNEYLGFLEGRPGAEWALAGVIRCARRLGDFERVAKAQKAFIKAGHQTPEAWCDYGETLIRLKRFSDAEGAFENAAKLDPTCVRAYQAPELIRIEKARSEGEKLFQQARDAMAKRFFLTATERLERALDLVPNEASWMRQLAEVNLRIGSLGRASELLSKVRAAEPRDFWVGFQLARVYESEEKAQLAIELLSSALEDHPLELEAHLLLLRLKRSQIQGDRFERDMLVSLVRHLQSQLAEFRKKSPVPLLVEGYANYIFGFGTRFQPEAFKRGEETFQEVLRTHADTFLAHRGLSLMARATGDLKKAVHHAKEAVRLSSDPGELFSLARLYENFQNFTEARECYSSLRNLFPENGLYRRRIIEMLDKESQSGHKNELMDFLTAAQEKLKTDSPMWLLHDIGWAQTCIARRSPQREEWARRSLLTWHKAGSLPEPSPWIRWGLMEAQMEFLKGGERSRALNQHLKVCEKIVRDTPDLAPAHAFLGICYRYFDDVAQTDRAVKHLETAAFIDPIAPYPFLLLARSYRELGRPTRVDAVRYAMILLEPELTLKI